MGTSYIPLPPWALAFCWVPLWLDLRTETSLKRTFWKAWWAQFVLSLIGFHWVAYVAHEFGYLPWPVAILVLLGFCAGVHLYIPLACVAVKALERKIPMNAFAFFVLLAAAHNLGETLWPSLFPWNLGYPLLGAGFSVAQWSDVVGFLGLSFAMHLINAVLAGVYLKADRKIWVMTLSGLVLVWTALTWTGVQRAQVWAGGDKSLRVLQVQANVGNFEKVMAEKGAGFQNDIKDRYFRLTDKALAEDPNVDFIIWPESAYPDFLGAHNAHRFYNSELVRFVQKNKVALITGGYANDPPQTPDRRDYNGMFLYQPNGTPILPYYHKTYLLAFGEYVPFGEMFPILKKYNPGGPGFGRGSGPTLFSYQGVNIGPQICYESLYPDFTAALIRKGAHVLVNLTNDSWFGPGFEPQQHMVMTLARAVESRRPLLRSTNTGITTAILADGTRLQMSPTFQEWTSVFEIPYRETTEQTFYVRFGHLWPWVLLLIGAIAIVGGRRRVH